MKSEPEAKPLGLHILFNCMALGVAMLLFGWAIGHDKDGDQWFAGIASAWMICNFLARLFTREAR